jgi:hypothetical protein
MEGLEGDDAMTIGWYRDLAMSALPVFRERRPRYYIVHQHNHRPLTQYHSYQSSESKPRSREYLLGSGYRFSTP